MHQVGDPTKVILRCTVNQPSRVTTRVQVYTAYRQSLFGHKFHAQTCGYQLRSPANLTLKGPN